MENCSKNHEKIIFYNDLSNTEKETLQKHLESCENCRDDFKKINSIQKLLNQGISSSHTDNERLVRFVIFENFPDEPDFDGEKLSSQEVMAIRKHIEGCQDCNDKYYEMKSEYETLEHFIRESNIPDYQLGQNPVRIKVSERISQLIKILAETWKSLNSHPKPKYILAPAAVIAVLLLFFVFLPFFKGTEVTYQSLAKLESKKITYLTRGLDVNELQQGIASFNAGNYSESIQQLESFISSKPNHPHRAFAEYVCGLAYLFHEANSEENLRLVHYQYIDNGIQHLQTSLSLSTNLRIQENDAWYLGKAFLMKKNASEAIEYFEKVKTLRGRNSKKAQEILADIEKNLIYSK